MVVHREQFDQWRAEPRKGPVEDASRTLNRRLTPLGWRRTVRLRWARLKTCPYRFLARWETCPTDQRRTVQDDAPASTRIMLARKRRERRTTPFAVACASG